MSGSEEYRKFAEEVALYFEQAGQSRTVGRVFGWLLICDPPQQTMNELVDGLQMSKSSVSTSTRFLIQTGLIQRLSLPGERRDYFRISEGVWGTLMRQRTAQLTAFRQLAERGLALLGQAPPARRQRLREMREFYAFFEREFPLILDRWETARGQNEADS